MDINSPRLQAVLDGDDRHPREIAKAKGKAILDERSVPTNPLELLMGQTVSFNPAIGGLEFAEEGAVVFCKKIKEEE